uniref:Uncharacterized protein n=1 Tax=Heterorhabditis bacteriophora TaxID=37862 RepID=A0A1I7WQZ2_HETBA
MEYISLYALKICPRAYVKYRYARIVSAEEHQPRVKSSLTVLMTSITVWTNHMACEYGKCAAPALILRHTSTHVSSEFKSVASVRGLFTILHC